MVMHSRPDFPVTWEHPTDARLFWTLDRTRLPAPVTPMTYEYMTWVYSDAFNIVAQAYDMPIRARVRRFNTYCYQAIIPVGAPPEQIMRTLGWLRRKAPRLVDEILGVATRSQTKRMHTKLDAVMLRLREVWNGEFLPEIKERFHAADSFDLRGATLLALLAYLQEMGKWTKRLWEIHFRIVFPVQLAQSMFADLYQDLFGDTHAFDAYRLLQGFDNKIRQADRGLWELSRKALLSPEVRQVLGERSVVAAPAGYLAALKRSSAGQAFLSELHAYLNEYGQRGDELFELSHPSWLEDPSPVFAILKDYMSQPERNWGDELVALATERERLLAQVRERLHGYPAAVASRFELLLEAAQAAAVIAEDHNFWIDLCGPYQVRRVLVECGRRLAEVGALQHGDDVFYLTLEELSATLEALPHIDRRQLVAGRRAEVAYFRTIAPPPALGMPPHLPPPNSPLVRAVSKALGGPPQPSLKPEVLLGAAAAPGTVRGRARVIRSLAEAGRLRHGDVLVTETTATLWTPLFAIAAAVITDSGGILSHAAIVAREHRIPAVVGTGSATIAIRDGQLLEVDGDAGIVRIVGSEREEQKGHM